MKDSSHWYDSTGKAVFEVANKSKPGNRPTTIRDARTLGLLPSVTTVLNILSKPQLDDWKHRQITTWCFQNRPDVLDTEQYHVRAVEGAFQQVSDAADLGTNIHKALELHFQNLPFDQSLTPYVEAVDKWVTAEKIVFVKHELRLASRVLGFAGTTDAIIKCPRGNAILDFKSRKTVAGKPCTPYDTQPMQLAAYGEIAFNSPEEAPHAGSMMGHGVNLFISTTEPGRVDACWYDQVQMCREWEAFYSALQLWRHIKGYDPRKGKSL